MGGRSGGGGVAGAGEGWVGGGDKQGEWLERAGLRGRGSWWAAVSGEVAGGRGVVVEAGGGGVVEETRRRKSFFTRKKTTSDPPARVKRIRSGAFGHGNAIGRAPPRSSLLNCFSLLVNIEDNAKDAADPFWPAYLLSNTCCEQPTT
jgi:hypothetical protein